jgi:hypothetical protein
MNTDIESKINEAEVCRSMGLFEDSLKIYEKILGSVSSQDAPTHQKIEKRIRLLKQEIDSEEETAPKGVSQKDISMLRERLSFSIVLRPLKRWGCMGKPFPNMPNCLKKIIRSKRSFLKSAKVC